MEDGEACVTWARRFIFNGTRHPADMGEIEVTRVLSWLAVRRRVSVSTENRAPCAILFLHREVLEKDLRGLDTLVRAKRPARSPVVLTRGEVRAVLDWLTGTTRLTATLLYGDGAWVLERARLRV